MLAALEEWARAECADRPDLLRLGYFGSFATGADGVGSDLDLVAVVEESKVPFASRRLDWDLLELPVPADLLVYTQAEWDELVTSGGRFAQVMAEETIWLKK